MPFLPSTSDPPLSSPLPNSRASVSRTWIARITTLWHAKAALRLPPPLRHLALPLVPSCLVSTSSPPFLPFLPFVPCRAHMAPRAIPSLVKARRLRSTQHSAPVPVARKARSSIPISEVTAKEGGLRLMCARRQRKQRGERGKMRDPQGVVGDARRSMRLWHAVEGN